MKYVKLEGHKYAKANVGIYESGNIELQSYSTIVIIAIKLDDGKYQLRCTGLYSNTTRKHISWFISEYFGNIDYYVIKDAYENKLDVITDLTK